MSTNLHVVDNLLFLLNSNACMLDTPADMQLVMILTKFYMQNYVHIESTKLL